MCKVLIMTGITDSDAAFDFMKAAEPEMTSGNTDGIGYSAINSKNELFMEKWHQNSKFLNTVNVELNKDYMTYGNVTRDDLKTVTMHTRFATCGRSMENTHPFVYNETSLIHNGVISNSHTLGLNKISTCDSESALQLYLNKELATSTKSAYQAFLDELRGYWAFGILAKGKDGTYMLDVIKGGAQLYFAYIPELGPEAIIFATTQQIILSACKITGFSVPKISNLVDNSLTKFNALTGKIVANAEFEAKKTSYTSTYSTYFNDDKEDKKYSEFSKQFLNSSSDKRNNSKLITYDKDYAYIDNNLTDSEMEIFDASQSSVSSILKDYDEYLGSNYAIFYNRMPSALKNLVESKKNSAKLRVRDILRVIEAYNDAPMGKYKKAYDLLLKFAA